MNTPALLPQETILAKTQNSNLILTNFRLQYRSNTSSTAHYVSMMLEKISSIEITYKSHPIYLILGILIPVLGISIVIDGPRYMQEETMPLMFLGIGLVFILLFFTTRMHILSIASDGGAKINFKIKGMKRDALLDLINTIEDAKNQRFMGYFNTP